MDAIHQAIEGKNQIHAKLKASRLTNKDLLIRFQFVMYEGSSDITLCSAKTKVSGQSHHGANRAPLNTPIPCLKESNTLSLTISMDTNTSLKLHDKAIGKTLDPKSPGARENFHQWLTFDELPRLQLNFQGFHCSRHSLPPFVSVSTIHHLPAWGIGLITFAHFSLQDVETSTPRVLQSSWRMVR